MELLPIGPVVIVDTPGFDDTGELGAQRVARTAQVLQTMLAKEGLMESDFAKAK